MVLWYGGSCKEVCGTILWVGQQDDSTTLQVSTPCIDDHHFKEEEMKSVGGIVTSMLSNCSKNVYTWHEVEDPTFHGQWTNLHDQSQNGPKPVTNAWIDWFHTFIMHANTNSIAMWVILQNHADWDCFKTLTSREIARIKNPLLEEYCAFWEVIHLFQ